MGEDADLLLGCLKFVNQGDIAYELELPQVLALVRTVFHVSMLKKCMGDPSLIVQTKNDWNKDRLSYEEIPVHILDDQV